VLCPVCFCITDFWKTPAEETYLLYPIFKSINTNIFLFQE
jgi:hypothetical protein